MIVAARKPFAQDRKISDDTPVSLSASDRSGKGKAELELAVPGRTEEVRASLRAIGFEKISWPEGSTSVAGRMPIETIELLLNIEAVLRIAPHYR